VTENTTPDEAEARRDAAAAGLLLLIDGWAGPLRWLLYRDQRLLLTWFPKRGVAQRPDTSRPDPKMRAQGSG
jgi:hypothetical protein